MKFIHSKYLFLLFLIFTGCTISMTNVSTHGTAADVVDDTQAATANPEITVPVSAI